MFTNLYFEHSYYWCANGIWLLLALALALTAIHEHLRMLPMTGARWVVPAFLVLWTIGGFAVWERTYLPILRNLPPNALLQERWGQPVRQVVPESRTLLILGMDWNPMPLYYAQRRGIAFPTVSWIPFDGPQLKESLALLAPEERLGAVVIANNLLTEQNGPVLQAFLGSQAMSLKGRQTAFGVLFPALDLEGKSP